MLISEMITELSEIMTKCGNMVVVLHDSADGSDFVGMSIYADTEYPPECVIGFDSDTDIR